MNSMKKLREHEEHNFYKRIWSYYVNYLVLCAGGSFIAVKGGQSVDVTTILSNVVVEWF
jgi:hypothetical protein